jgi:hypothetical protein
METQEDKSKPEAPLRKYTKEFHSEERFSVAIEIKKNRKDFFDQKKEIREKINYIYEQLKSKQPALDVLQVDLKELESSISEKSSSVISRVFEYFRIKKLESDLGVKKEDTEKLKQEVFELLNQQESLEKQLMEKQDFNRLKEIAQKFYDSHIDDFKSFKEKKRVEELEKFEIEEKQRQVEQIMAHYNGYFVHGISHQSSPGGNSLMQDGTSFEAKLKLMLTLDPTIPTSVIQKGDGGNDMWAQMGVLVTRGRVDAAHGRDASSIALGVTERHHGFASDTVDAIEKSVSGGAGGSMSYNEFLISSPQVAGMYLSDYRKDRNNTISDKEFFYLAEQVGLPTFFIKGGEVFAVAYDEKKDQLVIGEKIDPKTLSEQVHKFTEQEKKEILDEVLEKEMPFDIERLLPEALLFSARSSGMEQYLKIKGNEFAKLEIGQVKKTSDLGIDHKQEDYNKKLYLKGEKVRIIKEVVHPNGELKRYFENDGNIFIQGWDHEKKQNTPEFSTMKYERSNLENNSKYFRISKYNTWKLDQPANTVDTYLRGMENELLRLKQENDVMDVKNEEKRIFNQNIISRLIYHLYGFADVAKELGDDETYQTAIKIANSVLSLEEYQASVKKRIDVRGRFLITKEDII